MIEMKPGTSYPFQLRVEGVDDALVVYLRTGGHLFKTCVTEGDAFGRDWSVASQVQEGLNKGDYQSVDMLYPENMLIIWPVWNSHLPLYQLSYQDAKALAAVVVDVSSEEGRA